MAGKDYLRRLRELLDENSTGTWLDDRTSYDNLYEGAKEFVSRTQSITNYYEFKTDANKSEYVLPAKFLHAYLRDSSGNFIIKYSNGSNDTYIKYRDINDIKYSNNMQTVDIQQGTLTTSATTLQDTGQDFSDWDTALTTSNAAYIVTLTNTVGAEFWAYLGVASTTTNANDTVAVYTDLGQDTTGWNGGTPSGTASHYRIRAVSSQSIPSYFAIQDKKSLYSQITGTTTSDGAASGGECTLTDTSGLFITTDYVSVGDIVHNTTDTSIGVVVSITSGTALKTALFNGTNNDWTSGDAYVIQPQGRLQIVLDPPPNTSGHIVRVDYTEKPDPVYSDYGTYRFRDVAIEAIIKYAAWLYKYRDSDPNFGDNFYAWFDKAVRRETANINPHLNERKIKVSFKRR